MRNSFWYVTVQERRLTVTYLYIDKDPSLVIRRHNHLFYKMLSKLNEEEKTLSAEISHATGCTDMYMSAENKSIMYKLRNRKHVLC